MVTHYRHHLYTRIVDIPMGISVCVLFHDPPDGGRVAKGKIIAVTEEEVRIVWEVWERGDRPVRDTFTEAELRCIAFEDPHPPSRHPRDPRARKSRQE